MYINSAGVEPPETVVCIYIVIFSATKHKNSRRLWKHSSQQHDSLGLGSKNSKAFLSVTG